MTTNEILIAIIHELQIIGQEPAYQHTGEDWGVGLMIAQDVIEKYLQEEE